MRQNLLIEQYNDGSLVKVHRLHPGATLTLGGGRNSAIRWQDDGQGEISCVDGEWSFTSNGQKRKVDRQMDFGSVSLKCTHYVQKEKLFAQETGGSRGESVHLIVIRRDGELVKTEILPAHQAFTDPVFVDFPLVPGKPSTMKKGEFVVTSRVVTVDREIPRPEKRFDADQTFIMRSAVAVLVLLVAVLSASFFSTTTNEPEKPKEQQIAELKSNRFTKMVYDSEEFRQAQKRAGEILKENFNSEVAETDSAESQEVSAPTKEVIKGLQNSGIGNLIGQIARSSVVSADSVQVRAGGGASGGAGQNLAAASSGLSGKAAEGKGRYKLDGVKTAGLAGSGGNLKGIAKLAAGRTGTGEVDVVEEETVIEGGLAPEVIAGVIRRHLGEVRYCYERQLSQHNDLEGKVQLNFAIGGDGKVTWQKVSQTTLNNAMVEGCILRRVAKWQFPQPKGGTAVHVTYPFLLKSIN